MKNIDKLLESRVVAVMRKLPFEHIEDIALALVDGGVTGLEITVDSDRAYEAIQKCKAAVGDRAIIGAGTVLNGEHAEEAIDAGAEFIFAPILDEETIKVANKHQVIVIPGVFTPTEAQQAYLYGADIVKVFPADSLGPAFIKGLQGPLGHIPMMPTGGIDETNIASYIKAGAVAAGAGGSLLKKSLIEQQDWQGLRDHAATFVKAARV
ncbi:2-dehydro-3-deoxyphosphogluconate aldolase [Bacillaceae bacterium JMAK1]|nr:2-dehydro-3-deoxyphosphogluconate aldolase [Bacillaceae bacterium JMAK1]